MEFGPVIKNPVLDINKLVRQGTMLNQSVQNVEGDSTADQATVDLLAKKDPVIHEIAVGMSGEELTQYTVSGTPPLSLTNSLGKPLKAWSVDLLPYQEGTGDPSPDNVRPIHGTDKLTITTAGKNLGKPVKSATFGGITTVLNADGSTDVSGTATQNGGRLGLVSDTFTLKAGKYTFSAYQSTGTPYSSLVLNKGSTNFRELNANVQQSTFTLTEDANDFSVGINIYNGTTYSGVLRYQIELSSTASDFTHYLAPSQTVLTLPQTVYTGTIGSDGGESRWGEVDLGTLTWYYAASWGSSPSNFNAIVSDIKHIDAMAMPNMLVSIYKPVKAIDMYHSSNTNFIAQNIGGVRISDARFTDSNAFKSAMQGIKLYYELATPATFAVSSVTIPTPTGTATTWATAEDGTVDGMEVTYVGKA